MESNYVPEFVKSTVSMIKSMTDIELKMDEPVDYTSKDIKSYGICSSIGFIGQIKGKMLLNADKNLALKLTEIITGEVHTEITDSMVMMTLSEINNIISGDAITNINNNLNYHLRLTPPIVFTGNPVTVSIPKIPMGTVIFNTEYGQLLLNVAYEEVKMD